MPSGLLRRPGIAKPGPARVNWRHPLSRGLILAWHFAASRNELVTNTAPSHDVVLRPVVNGGVAIRNSGSETGLRYSLQSRLHGRSAISHASLLNITHLDYSMYANVVRCDGTFSPLQQPGTAGNHLRSAIWTPGISAGEPGVDMSGARRGTPIIVGTRWTSGQAVQIWRRGAGFQASTPTATGTIASGSQPICFLASEGGGERHTGSASLLTFFWDRSLAAEEFELLEDDPLALFWPGAPLVVGGEITSSGSTYDDTLSEGLGLGDALVVAATLNAPTSDTATLDEGAVATAAFAASQTYPIAPADAFNLDLTGEAGFSDPVTVGESVAVSVVAAAALAVSVGLAESLAATLSADASTSDALTPSDALVAHATMVAATSGNVTVADSLADALDGGSSTHNDSITDAIGLGDALAVALTAIGTSAEAVTMGDALGAALNIAAPFSGSVALTYDVSGNLDSVALSAASIVVADALAPHLGVQTGVADHAALDALWTPTFLVSAGMADAVLLGDALYAGDVGLSALRVWHVPHRSRVALLAAQSRVWRVPLLRRDRG